MRLFEATEIECTDDEAGYLGTGFFGKSCICFHEDKTVLVLKSCPAKIGRRERALLEIKLQQGIGVLQESKHSCIARVEGWLHLAGGFALLVEHFPAGNLKDFLLDSSIVVAPLLRLRISAEIARGIAFIYKLFGERNLGHGNIKPENVLMTERLHCKVSDFGEEDLRFSVSMAAASWSRDQDTEVFPPHPCPHLRKRDSFAFGATLHMLLARECPTPPGVLLYSIRAESGARPSFEGISRLKDELRRSRQYNDVTIIQLMEEVMTQCLRHCAPDRPEMTQVRDRMDTRLNKYDDAIIEEHVTDALRDVIIRKPSRDLHSCVRLARGDETKVIKRPQKPAKPPPPPPPPPPPKPAPRRSVSADASDSLPKPTVRSKSISCVEEIKGIMAETWIVAPDCQQNMASSRLQFRKQTSLSTLQENGGGTEGVEPKGGRSQLSNEDAEIKGGVKAGDEEPQTPPTPTAPPRRNKNIKTKFEGPEDEPIYDVGTMCLEDHVYETINLTLPKSTKPPKPKPKPNSRYVVLPVSIPKGIRKKPANLGPKKRTTSLPAEITDVAKSPNRLYPILNTEGESNQQSSGDFHHKITTKKPRSLPRQFSTPLLGSSAIQSEKFPEKINSSKLWDQETFFNKLDFIKSRLLSGDFEAAKHEISDVVAAGVPQIEESKANEAVKQIISIVSLSDIKHFAFELTLLRLGLELNGGIQSDETRLDNCRECARACRDVARSLYRDVMKDEIEERVLPLIREVLQKISFIHTRDAKLKTEARCWCLYYQACCHGYADKHGLMIDGAGEAILLMKRVFGGDSAKKSVVASCYELRATGNHLIGNFSKAAKEYENEIAMLGSVEDLEEEERENRVIIAKSRMNKLRDFGELL